MRYLVEFRLPQDQSDERETDANEEETEDLEDEDEEESDTKVDGKSGLVNDVCLLSVLFSFIVSLSDVKDITDPLSKVDAGLKVDGGNVPLHAVHIRAQLIDLAAKVTL